MCMKIKALSSGLRSPEPGSPRNSGQPTILFLSSCVLRFDFVLGNGMHLACNCCIADIDGGLDSVLTTSFLIWRQFKWRAKAEIGSDVVYQNSWSSILPWRYALVLSWLTCGLPICWLCLCGRAQGSIPC